MASSSIVEKAERLQIKIETWIEKTKKSWNENPNLDFDNIRVLKYIPFVNQLYIEKKETVSKLIREIFVMWFVIHHLGGVNELTFWNIFEWLNYMTIIHVLSLGPRLEDFEFLMSKGRK